MPKENKRNSITDQIDESLDINKQLIWEDPQVKWKVDELLEQNHENILKEDYTSYLKENSRLSEMDYLIDIDRYSIHDKKVLFLRLLSNKLKKENRYIASDDELSKWLKWEENESRSFKLDDEVFKLLEIKETDKSSLDFNIIKKEDFNKTTEEWRPAFLWGEIETIWVRTLINPNYFHIEDNVVYLDNFNRELSKLINYSFDEAIKINKEEWLMPDKKELMKVLIDGLISDAKIELENEELYVLYKNWIDNWVKSSLNNKEIDWYTVLFKSFYIIFWKLFRARSHLRERYYYITARDKEWNEKRAVIGEDKKLYFKWSDEFEIQLKSDKYKNIVNWEDITVLKWLY